MMAYYLEGMDCSEGSEQERYTHIYLDLSVGMTHCFDQPLDLR